MAAARSNAKIAINCDMGESFGLYKMGDDEGLMPHITIANVACGFHASDPSVMAKTVRLAKRHNVKVGAPPSLPDLQGFGRREMKMRPEELTDCIVYQVGALKGFLSEAPLRWHILQDAGAYPSLGAFLPNLTAMMASDMPAAISPYSIAVAPLSSERNLRMMLIRSICGQNPNIR